MCEKWYGFHRFKINKVINTRVYSISTFKKIDYIDWVVMDVQGKDLSIIKSIKNKIRDNISIVEIETGFYPFYKKADTIPEVFNFMSQNYEFEDMRFGTNFKTSSKNKSKLDKEYYFHGSF